MNVQERITADKLLSEFCQPRAVTEAVSQANAHLDSVGLPDYTELVNALLAWNRASDHCKSVSQAPGAKGQVRTAAERAHVASLEALKRDASHRLNQLIDRLPRGL